MAPERTLPRGVFAGLMTLWARASGSNTGRTEGKDVSTRRLCPDPAQMQENALLRPLETINRASIDGLGRLVMRNDRDTVLKAAPVAQVTCSRPQPYQRLFSTPG